jgi:hypothetical protein
LTERPARRRCCRFGRRADDRSEQWGARGVLSRDGGLIELRRLRPPTHLGHLENSPPSVDFVPGIDGDGQLCGSACLGSPPPMVRERRRKFVLGSPARATAIASSAATPSGLPSVGVLSIQNTFALSHCSLTSAWPSTGVKKSCQVLPGGEASPPQSAHCLEGQVPHAHVPALSLGANTHCLGEPIA